MVTLRRLAFTIVLLGFIMNMALFGISQTAAPEIWGMQGSSDSQALQDIDSAASEIDLSTNSFESFLANIMLLEVFTSVWDFIFIWPKVLSSIPGIPSWIGPFLGYPMSFLWLCAGAYIISSRSV